MIVRYGTGAVFEATPKTTRLVLCALRLVADRESKSDYSYSTYISSPKVYFLLSDSQRDVLLVTRVMLTLDVFLNLDSFHSSAVGC